MLLAQRLYSLKVSVSKCVFCENTFFDGRFHVSLSYVYIKFFNVQAIIAEQDSQIELQHTFQLKSKESARHHSSVLLEQEKQRNLEKHKEELANLHKLQAQHREEQQRWEKERERQRMQIEILEAELQQREEECGKREEKLNEEKAVLERQREDYQQGLERLRETTKSLDKEKDRLDQLQEKIKKWIPNPGSDYDDPVQVRFIHIVYSSVHEFSVLTGIQNVY